MSVIAVFVVYKNDPRARISVCSVLTCTTKTDSAITTLAHPLSSWIHSISISCRTAWEVLLPAFLCMTLHEKHKGMSLLNIKRYTLCCSCTQQTQQYLSIVAAPFIILVLLIIMGVDSTNNNNYCLFSVLLFAIVSKGFPVSEFNYFLGSLMTLRNLPCFVPLFLYIPILNICII